MEIISLKEARATNALQFNSGVPCKHGHLAMRYVKSRGCQVCAEIKRHEPAAKATLVIKNRIRRATPEHKAKEKAYWKTPRYKSLTRARLYKITPSQEYFILAGQQYRCAICNTDEAGTNDKAQAWHLDHDHSTKKVRGFLCRKCNLGLGHFNDDPRRLIAAAGYLSNH